MPQLKFLDELHAATYERIINLLMVGYSCKIYFVFKQTTCFVYEWLASGVANAIIWDFLVDGEIWNTNIRKDVDCPHFAKIVQELINGHELQSINFCISPFAPLRKSPRILRKVRSTHCY